jgi:cytochrome oxidase Cu insertion factor (SCO1/SenC/PrrC family)
MKKVMLAMGFLAFVFFTQASEKFDVSNASNNLDKTLIKQSVPVMDENGKDPFSCTYTQKASISIYFVNYEISCSATSASCKQAILEATACANEGLALLREFIK